LSAGYGSTRGIASPAAEHRSCGDDATAVGTVNGGP
jgi:hypothetical protein